MQGELDSKIHCSSLLSRILNSPNNFSLKKIYDNYDFINELVYPYADIGERQKEYRISIRICPNVVLRLITKNYGRVLSIEKISKDKNILSERATYRVNTFTGGFEPRAYESLTR